MEKIQRKSGKIEEFVEEKCKRGEGCENTVLSSISVKTKEATSEDVASYLMPVDREGIAKGVSIRNSVGVYEQFDTGARLRIWIIIQIDAIHKELDDSSLGLRGQFFDVAEVPQEGYQFRDALLAVGVGQQSVAGLFQTDAFFLELFQIAVDLCHIQTGGNGFDQVADLLVQILDVILQINALGVLTLCVGAIGFKHSLSGLLQETL